MTDSENVPQNNDPQPPVGGAPAGGVPVGGVPVGGDPAAGVPAGGVPAEQASQPAQPPPEVTSGTVPAQPQPAPAEGAAAEPAAGAAEAAPTRHRAEWLRSNPMSAIALAWLIVGVAISIFAAQRVARDDASASRGDFGRSASTVASGVKTGLQRWEDAMTAAGTYFSGNSNGTPAEFHAWGRWARALRNHPDVQTLSLLALVNPKQLAAFEKRLGADPKTFALVPPVKGGEHCLAFTAISHSVATLPPQGLDFCAANPALRATRDSGQTTVAATPVASGEVIEEQTPVYRGAAPPVSSVGRKAAFVGWLRTVIEPKAMLQRVLGAMPGGAARLRHTTHGSNTVYAVGTPQAGAQTAAVDLHGGWTLTLSAPNTGAGVFDNLDSTAVLIGGLLLSILAGIIVLAYPGLTLVTLAVILGIWLVILGVMECVLAWRLRSVR